MFANTIIHSKKGCIYCEKAKVELDSLSIQYEEVNYDPEDPDYKSRAAALVARTGHKTFPQIFDGQVFLGGYSELKKLLSVESAGTYKFNVKKREGSLKPVDTSEIEERLKFLAIHPYVLESVDVFNLTRTIVNALYNGIETSKIDELSMSCAAELGSDEPEYLTLAARIAVNNHQKNTLGSFFDRMKVLMDNVDSEGLPTPILDEAFFSFVQKYARELESMIVYSRDYLLSYFGFKTLEKGCLLKTSNKVVVERPQDMFMRVSVFMHFKSLPEVGEKVVLDRIRECYDMLSKKLFTHASPTIFNSGTKMPGGISCFLLDVPDDTPSIFNVLKSCGLISKACGGIGFSLSKLRSKGSIIKGSNGVTLGLVPFMKLFETTGTAFNQSSKREGKFVLYLDMHHPDIISFIRTKFNTGNENEYCKDISIALWVSDLFMKRVKADDIWSTFNPQYHSDLLECYGEEYEKRYIKLENTGKFTKQYKAREIWEQIMIAQSASGMPYILFKDQVNRVSNQQNVGIVRTSNLCAEITEVSDYKEGGESTAEFACCTLASLALPEFVEDAAPHPNDEFPALPFINYQKLQKVVSVAVRNLNNLIDNTHYPTSETERSNRRHRPLGLGVQGLADVFCKFRCSYESERAEILNANLFEHIYYYALDASCSQAQEIYVRAVREVFEKGRYSTGAHSKVYTNAKNIETTFGAYSTFAGSPLSKGILNFDYYGEPRVPLCIEKEKWDSLRSRIKTYGVRNALLLACMPTATTSNILGNTECFEPISNNIYVRITLSGEFLSVNKYLVHELKDLDLWNDDIIMKIKKNRGEVTSIVELPESIRYRYKTVWEISQRAIIELAAGRQRFVCQSQSMNLHFRKLTTSKFTTAMMLAWEKKLKTGCYYMRTQSAAKADQTAITGAKEAAPAGVSDCCGA